MTWAYPPPAAPPKQQNGHRLKGVTKGSYTDEQRDTAPHTQRGVTYPQDEITASGKHEPFIKVEQEGGKLTPCPTLQFKTFIFLILKEGRNNIANVIAANMRFS